MVIDAYNPPCTRMALRLAILIASAMLAATPARAQTERRGPFPSRDEWMLAQPLLTLPATSPDPLPRGGLELRVAGDWGSDFSVVGAPGRRLTSPSYFVDGEHRSGAVTVRRGFGGGLTLGLRASVAWRGTGMMDGIIDFWHRAFGLPDGGRSLFPDDSLRVEARDATGRPLPWTGRAGTGLGNLELEANQVLIGRHDASGWRAAVVARLSAPTATGPFADAGSGAGLQLVAARPLGGRTNVYLGVGTTVFSRREILGLEYARVRPQGFLSLEGRVTRGWSMIVQLDAASRLVRNVEDYPGGTMYLRVGSKFGWRAGWMLEGGITEGVRNQTALTDFGVFAALARRF
jgi:hypothetical protein